MARAAPEHRSPVAATINQVSLSAASTLDALQRYKGGRALMTWDDTFERLLKEAGEDL